MTIRTFWLKIRNFIAPSIRLREQVSDSAKHIKNLYGQLAYENDYIAFLRLKYELISLEKDIGPKEIVGLRKHLLIHRSQDLSRWENKK